jgi:hypothetical protein
MKTSVTHNSLARGIQEDDPTLVLTKGCGSEGLPVQGFDDGDEDT